jgi:clan AA aspartic protease (TIGR02281 family)
MKKIMLTCIILIITATVLKSQVRIKMQKEGGVYTTPCSVNGLRLRFIFDTGASNVSMSLSEAIFMLKNGYLDEKDLHGSSYTQIANGDIVENTTVNIKELEIGGIKIHNVEATIIHELSAPLLLGLSAIQKLGKIQIDDNNLIIFNFGSPSNENACNDAKELVAKARQYYFDELAYLSAETYQKAYDLCPDALDCFSLSIMGTTYLKSSNYSSSIKYLEMASKCETKEKDLYFIFSDLANAYIGLGNFESAILNIQKALTNTTENFDIFHCYFDLGYIFTQLKEYNHAVEYFEKSGEFYLKYLSSDNNEVMKGKIKNQVLGETYSIISNNYYKLGQQSKSDKFLIKSALCGNENAIISCKKYGLNYELYIE